ncbi:MAG: 4Fe-4S dicluster domain-containing protein [Nitrospirae bacterium]|nr:4Fe-4S dicluster domain-containing protein [Nitrospirota bacterium]
MGHIYKKLGDKIDGLSVRAPWDETFHKILAELYSPEEAEVVVKMPYAMANLGRIGRVTGIPEARLRNTLEGLADKGLVLDLFIGGEYVYMPSPMVIGIFEFTMMRAGGVDHKKLAGLFREYMFGDFGRTNFAEGRIAMMRALPYESVIKDEPHVEVLDYERARSIIEGSRKFSIGTCSCRHEKLHAGEKTCDVPLDTCSSFGFAADYLIRHGLAKEVSKTEAFENLARSKELGLVLNADNVRNGVAYICHCCGCCCNVLLGVSRHGYGNIVVTSGFVPDIEPAVCKGCGQCAKACPVGAMKMHPAGDPQKPRKMRPAPDASVCLGCGVCGLNCKTGALKLGRGEKKPILPEDTFERVILQCLEKGTLQNMMFDDPGRLTHRFLRGFVGGFLKLPPVKRALTGDMLRSRFLEGVKAGAARQGGLPEL